MAIQVRPSDVEQIREALRTLLDGFDHDFPTDEAWLDDATSRVYNRLAAEREPQQTKSLGGEAGNRPPSPPPPDRG